MQVNKPPFPVIWISLSVVLLIASARPVCAEVRLPKVFNNHMVMQQEKPLVIWGWANPNETVKVQLGSQSAETRANGNGEWKVTMPAMKAGGPYSLAVTGSSNVQLEDVMMGEVWLCSGQSNMEMGIGMCNNSKEEIAGT